MSVIQKYIQEFKGGQFRAWSDLNDHLDRMEARIGGVFRFFVDDPAHTGKAPILPPPASFSVTGIDGKFITFIVNPQNVLPQSVDVQRNQWLNGVNVSNATILHNLQSATDLNFTLASNLKDYGTSPQLMWTDQDPNVTRLFRLRSSYDGKTWNAWQIFSSPLTCGPVGVQSGLLRTAALTPVNGAGTPTTQPLSAATGGPVNAATINIASFLVQYPPPIGNKSYSSGAITPLLDSTKYYVYCLDPTYAGGVQTYLASVNNPDVTGNDALVFLGAVTTPAHGGGGTSGSGGGNGPCFTASVLIKTPRGAKRISKIQPGDRVMTKAGWRRVTARLEHNYDGPMCDLGRGDGYVTPTHRFWLGPGGSVEGWLPARNIFPEGPRVTGTVYNLTIEGETDDEHCYTLDNFWIAHNTMKL